jgi:hypothetical protein
VAAAAYVCVPRDAPAAAAAAPQAAAAVAAAAVVAVVAVAVVAESLPTQPLAETRVVHLPSKGTSMYLVDEFSFVLETPCLRLSVRARDLLEWPRLSGLEVSEAHTQRVDT